MARAAANFARLAVCFLPLHSTSSIVKRVSTPHKMVRDVAPVHSESESEQETRRAAGKDKPSARDAMDVDDEGQDGGEEDEEYEIEQIVDARMGMFPAVRQVLVSCINGGLISDWPLEQRVVWAIS